MNALQVLLVQHAQALESLQGTAQLAGRPVQASCFDVDPTSNICGVVLARRVAAAQAIIVFDHSSEAARRDLMTFVGSIAPEQRGKVIVIPDGGYAGPWELLGLKIISDNERLGRLLDVVNADYQLSLFEPHVD